MKKKKKSKLPTLTFDFKSFQEFNDLTGLFVYLQEKYREFKIDKKKKDVSSAIDLDHLAYKTIVAFSILKKRKP